VYDKQSSAAASATQAATAIVADINARLSKFDWSLGPQALFSNDAEQLSRESRQQECNSLNVVNGNAEYESSYERLMQYEPSSSIFPSLTLQEPSCTPAQGITSAVGETDMSPVATPLAAKPADLGRVPKLKPGMRILSSNGNIDDESIPDHVDPPHEETHEDFDS